MSDKTKEVMEVLMVFILLTWVLSLKMPINSTQNNTPTVAFVAQPTVVKIPVATRTRITVSGISLDSSSDALIDYFADGIWREEQDTMYEKLDKAFSPVIINATPVTTTDF